MDALSAVEKGFREQLTTLWQRHPELAEIDEAEAERFGREGARAAVAPVLWRAAVGEVWDTSRVTEFLGISRQAVNQRVHNGSLLGLRGRGITLFPTWQFNIDRREVRPIVAALLATFRAATEVEPWTVASWAMTPQPELHGNTPAELLAKDESAEYEVMLAARHAAGRLAE